MSLQHSRPPESLAIELREVSRDASALIDVLDRGFNFPLPNEFPKDQLIDICKSLIQLPDGTAEGCHAPLDYARHRLPAIRREYILSEELSTRAAHSAPALTRGETLDQKLGTLISSVTTALDEYRSLSAEEAISETKPEGSVAPPEGAIADAAAEASSLDANIADVQQTVEDVVSPESQPADDFKRQLRDARSLNLLAFAEIRMPRVVVSWLRKSVDALKDYPGLIRQTAGGLRIGTDIIGIGLERWHEIERDISRFVVDQMHRTWDALDKVADVLETRRRKGGSSWEPPADFDLDVVRKMILRAEAPPAHWRPFITELDFSGETQLIDLSPLAELSSLRILFLAGAEARDVRPLSGLANLRNLDLAGTLVHDLTALSALQNLRYLNLPGTPVTDVSALSTLVNLERLILAGTGVTDISPLFRLKKLRTLVVAGRSISDVSAISGLPDLTSLSLAGTRIHDISALSALARLEILNLSNTRVVDLTPLSNLSSLQILSLPGTAVRDVWPLSGLRNLRSLNLAGTQVDDLAAIAQLPNLMELDLRHTPVTSVKMLSQLHKLSLLDLSGVRASDIEMLYTKKPNLKILGDDRASDE